MKREYVIGIMAAILAAGETGRDATEMDCVLMAERLMDYARERTGFIPSGGAE